MNLTCRRALAIATQIVAVASLGLVPASNSQAAESRHLTVVLPYVPNMESFAAFYAQKHGYFKEVGLEVKLIPGGQGIDQVQMVSSGIAQLGETGPTGILAAIDKGAPLEVIGGEYQSTPQAMTCRKDSGITTPAMLVGKTLGIKQSAQILSKAFFDKNGVSLKKIKTVSIGNSNISEIIAGKVDCMFTTFVFNEPFLIEQAGVPVNVIPIGKWGFNSQMDAWVVKKSFLAKPGNKKILADYMTAEAKAWNYAFKHPKAAAKFMVDSGLNPGLNIKQQTYQAMHQPAYMTSAVTAKHGILWINMQAWKENAQNAYKAGVTSKLINPETFITTEILKMAKLPKH